MLFNRTDTSLLGRWWWTVDRWLLAAFGLLILFGAFMIVTASPAVADRIGLDSPYYFTIRHFLLLVPALAIMFLISLLQPRHVLLLAAVVFAVGFLGLLGTFFIGFEAKGARRWVYILGQSVQPSEFVKPAFIVLNAWLLSMPSVRMSVRGWALPVLLLMAVIVPLLLQPDMGMTLLVVAVWLGQLFIAGLPFYLVPLFGGLCVFGLVSAYFMFDHVASRIDRFLDPASGDTYQVERALEAYRAGGLLGVGPGRGEVKNYIPDVHSDFIFAVAGEELGLIFCLVLLAVIAFIVLRGFWRAGQGPTFFVTLAASGLLIQFALQSLVNIGSSLNLLPTKGMTLPFVSYGGSSLLALAIGMGMLLSLTRKRTHKP